MDEVLNTEGSAGESFPAARSADGSTASVADANPVDAPAEVAETAPETQQDAPGATDAPETTETTPETETPSQEPTENAGEGTPTPSV